MTACRQYGDSTPEIKNNPAERWLNAVPLRRSLVAEGWRTPDAYDNSFAASGSFPAVYLFILHGWEDGFHDYDVATVAYVGMSRSLEQRWNTHPVLRELNGLGRFVQRWFKATPAKQLRKNEFDLIQRFDPPRNVQGRKRGVVLL